MPIRRNRDKDQIFMPSQKAIIAEIGAVSEELDEDLKKLKKVMINISDVNLEEAFWNDSISTSFTQITAAVIKGDGLRIRLENDEAKKVIESFNRCINVKRQTIEDWIEETWTDAIVHKQWFWRVDNRTPEYEDVDIQRLDPKTIEVREDPVMGYRKFIQHLDNFKYYRSKKQFYRMAGRENEDRYRKWDSKKVSYGDEYKRYLNLEEMKIHIPDEPYAILFGKFFNKPPIANALHYIVYKRWILWFMRKYSQKHWAPFIIIKIEDPKSTNYPTDPQEMQSAINNARTFIKQITSFGGAAVPGDYTFETLEKQTAKSSEIYTTYIRELDKQIMYTIFGSMGQREASGNELATSRILEKGWLRFIKGIRRKYELILTYFYSKCLLPYHGINDVSPEDIEIDWSSLIIEETYDLMRAILTGKEAGIWKDQNEMRKAAQSSFPFLDSLPKNENKSIDELIEQQAKAQTKTSAEGRLVAYNQQRKDT